jgi:Bax protein
MSLTTTGQRAISAAMNLDFLRVSLSLIFMVFAGLGCGASENDAFSNLPKRNITIENPEELFELFKDLNYTPEAWQSGILEVPRVYLTEIPARWQNNSQKLPVLEKKRIFFRLLAPSALTANDAINAERARLLSADANRAEDSEWMLDLAGKYKVSVEEGNVFSNQVVDQLKMRVDVIPVSLVLAQAAEESGWGTSRFSVEGNALFGQWDYSGNGMRPKNQRKELGNYGVAKFDSPLDSVSAYMLNLNTQNSYQRLRERRAILRKSSEKISGYELAKTLDKYSERGQAYVETIHSMMSSNKLNASDDAVLVGDEVIFLYF